LEKVERVVSIVHQKTLTVMMDMIDLMMTRGKGQVEPQSLDPPLDPYDWLVCNQFSYSVVNRCTWGNDFETSTLPTMSWIGIFHPKHFCSFLEILPIYIHYVLMNTLFCHLDWFENDKGK
jgi:hypothetical protein